MRLQYLLVMVVATLATSSGTISAARVLDNANLVSAEQVQPIDNVQTETRSRRFLRTADTNFIHKPHGTHPDNKEPVFIEDKLQKALTNPRKNKKLYARWYNSGFTVKQVESGLRQSESRELELVYKNLSLGYAKYFNRRRSQENK